MNEQDKKMLVPRLRFPEFQDAEEWSTKQLADVAALIKEKAGSKSYTLMSVTAGVGLVTQIEKFGKEIAGEAYKNYYVIKKGDFAYNKSSTKQHPEGQMALLENIDVGAVPNSIFSCFRVDKEFVSPYFLKYPFATNIHGKWLRNFIAVGARANGALNVDSKDLLTLPIVFPSLKEQKKITDCLSSIDELITVQTKKIGVLKDHKKGLMQQLFPAVGETIPQMRFPEFQDAGEWEPHSLGSRATKVGSGITPNGGDKNYLKTGRPFIRSQNVGWGELLLDDVAFIDEETHASFVSTEINNLDVLLNITGASIGRSVVADQRVVGGNVNQHVCIIRLKNTELSPVLFNQYLLSQYGQQQIYSFQAGGNRQGLNFAQVRSFSIPIPPTMEEQNRVAGCLSSINEFITAQTQKLDALKSHKKGLIQLLFPNSDGVME